jgi:hypothetical protein
MRNSIAFAAIFVLGCNSPSTGSGTNGIEMCQQPDGTTCAGVAGAAGPKGDTGPQGVAGPAGPQGNQGPKGDTGAQGPAGPQGAVGPTGSQGPTGPQGMSGPQGIQGVVGPAGRDGHTMLVQGKYNGALMMIGALAPLMNGASGLYLFPENNQPGNYPSNMVVTMLPSTMYYLNNNCTGASWVTTPNSPPAIAYNNQLVWVRNKTNLFNITNTVSFFNYGSYDDGSCHVSSGSDTGYPTTDSGLALNVAATQPWTVVYQ